MSPECMMFRQSLRLLLLPRPPPPHPDLVVLPRTSSHLLVSSHTQWHCPQGCPHHSCSRLQPAPPRHPMGISWSLCPKSIALLSPRPRHLLSETPVSQLQRCLTLSSSRPAQCSLCLRYHRPASRPLHPGAVLHLPPPPPNIPPSPARQHVPSILLLQLLSSASILLSTWPLPWLRPHQLPPGFSTPSLTLSSSLTPLDAWCLGNTDSAKGRV